MTTFVRKNIAVCRATFTPAIGTGTPGAATLLLDYKDPSGVHRHESLAMQLASGVWSVEWDTSASGAGTVFWTVYCFGGLQAATQGCFDVEANAANVG
jgi:hypothetical protein